MESELEETAEHGLPGVEEHEGSGQADPETDDNEAMAPDEWKVDEIVAKRRVNKAGGKTVTEYKIRWQGYDADGDTWEPEDQLHCPELVEEFNATRRAEEGTDTAEEDGNDDTPVGDGEYIVEKILRSRSKGGKKGRRVTEYLIQWKDYPGQDSWESKVNAPDLIAAFEAERAAKKNAAGSASRSSVQSGSKKSVAKDVPVSNRKLRTRSPSEAAESPAPKRTPAPAARKGFRVSKRSKDAEEEESAEQEDATEDVYEVAKVLDRRQGPGKNSCVEYRIQWKGNYKPTWEPEEKLQCQELISEFEEQRAKLPESEPSPKKSPVKSTARLRKPVARMNSGSKAPNHDQASASAIRTNGVRQEAAVLSEFVHDFGGKKLPKSAARAPTRYPRRDAVEQTLPSYAAKSVTEELPKGGSRSGGPKKAIAKKSTQVPVVHTKRFKDLMVYIMKDSEVVATKVFKYNPEDVGEWQTFSFDKSAMPFPDELIKVFGKLGFEDEFPGEVFYMVIQRAAPKLFLGVTEDFMRRRYPKTLDHLEPNSLLTVGSVPSTEVEEDEEMES